MNAATASGARIAFLGTGLMGAPMVRRLLSGGYEVTVWNRNIAKAQSLVAHGARLAATPEEAALGVTIVFTMLTDAAAVSEVLFDSGLAARLAAGSIVVDCSSITPDAARTHAANLARNDVRHVDAPVSGGVVGAAEGNLAIMAGGDAKVIESIKDVLALLGRVVHVGPHGAGQVAKLANQQIVAITIGAVAEAMVLVEAAGASREAFREAIRGGFAESRILELHGKRMVQRRFEPGGPSRLQLKDLKAVMNLAETLGLSLPLTQDIHRQFDAFVAGGGGDMDHSALLLQLERSNEQSTANGA
ncbi:NAD(P)-dependent oxidoreductase [Aquamicrobium sp. LC103]|uniref:NAD(P)-dependent oxidoreductase n=1 Tax=Aquamicrobium sp. LC103 TaxID=1120658 RepID=UPI00063EA603|nr:NAD(P)-dependent oxidoreductase [Aquamicrobium sp. LC103]TKT69836.1 NAD(P)-dependent oxidoreductase [Aquamicrobium sp. LC103]